MNDRYTHETTLCTVPQVVPRLHSSGDLSSSHELENASIDQDHEVDGDALWITGVNGKPITLGDSITLPSGVVALLNFEGKLLLNPRKSLEEIESTPAGFQARSTPVDVNSIPLFASNSIVPSDLSINPKDEFAYTSVDKPISFPAEESISKAGSHVAAIKSVSEGGRAKLDSNGCITVMPDEGFVGRILVNYSIERPTGESETKRLTVNVLPQFRWDSVRRFAPQSDECFRETDNGRNFAKGASRHSFTGVSTPLITGVARPATDVVGRMFNEFGRAVAEVFGSSDQNGSWSLSFPGVNRFTQFRLEVDYQRG